MQYQYKVKTDADGKPLVADGSVVPGVGIVRNGRIESHIPIENSNFELAGESPAATHLTGVVPQGAQPVQPTTESEQN